MDTNLQIGIRIPEADLYALEYYSGFQRQNKIKLQKDLLKVSQRNSNHKPFIN